MLNNRKIFNLKEKEAYFMLGFADVWIALAWWLTLLSAIAGIIYGACKWNSEGDDS